MTAWLNAVASREFSPAASVAAISIGFSETPLKLAAIASCGVRGCRQRRQDDRGFDGNRRELTGALICLSNGKVHRDRIRRNVPQRLRLCEKRNLQVIADAVRRGDEDVNRSRVADGNDIRGNSNFHNLPAEQRHLRAGRGRQDLDVARNDVRFMHVKMITHEKQVSFDAFLHARLAVIRVEPGCQIGHARASFSTVWTLRNGQSAATATAKDIAPRSAAPAPIDPSVPSDCMRLRPNPQRPVRPESARRSPEVSCTGLPQGLDRAQTAASALATMLN